jgi:tellurite resistance protein TerC
MTLAWLGLAAFIVAALALDLRPAAHGKAPSMRSAAMWSLVWTGIGVAFAAILAVTDDSRAAGEYLAGFLIEKSLSLDNLFVFAILFTFFAVPQEERRRLLVLGIAGAIVLRTIFILAGAAALDAFSGTTYILGVILVATAYKIAKSGGHGMDPEGSRMVKWIKGRFANPMIAVLVLIAAFDVMFALDSIPAIFAITRDTFIVFAANAFSLLGMVSLYFLLDGLLARFRHLHFALAAILAFVGAKLLLEDVWHPPLGLSLVVIAGALAVAALTSMLAERREAAAAPPR